ncbi:MAG: putative Zn-dependent protease [Myxococcota bacterium]|jgi:predicted Zn-dependent protease
MSTARRYFSTLLAIALLGTLTACGGLTGVGGTSLFVSEAQEIEIGQEVHLEIIQETPLLENAALTAYVTALGQQLVVVSDRPHLEHQFFVLDTEQINAFAAPGGFVYVTVGLMRKVNSRAELAGVMGHEVGHVSGLHGVRTMESQQLTGVLSDWLLGEDSSLGEVVGWATGTYLQTAHSQDMELEADMLGVTYAHKAGYNPWGIVDFFTLLRDLVGDSDPVSSFLSSHPEPAERIDESSKQIDGLGVAKDQAGLVIDDAAAPFMGWADVQGQLPAPGG